MINKSFSVIATVLIDTWWNVNVDIIRNGKKGDKVLIDTWWNVNICGGRLEYSVLMVLIDTWWNVNRF